MGKLCMFVHNSRHVMAMIVVQLAYAALIIVFKLAVADDANFSILVAYRLLFATIFMLPLALFFERGKKPKLTWPVFLLSFVSGLLGATLPNILLLVTMSLSSATFAAASTSIIPGLTFITAILFRLEKLELRSKASLVKLVGTLLGVGGTFVFALYKGSEVNIWSTHINLLSRRGGHAAHSNSHPVFGALVALAGYSAYTFWLLLQAKINKYIKGHYWNNFLMNMMGAIQSMAFALCKERDWNQWRLRWNVTLLATIYSGIIISGIICMIISWAVQQKGPLYVSIFNPLAIVIVAFVGSLALDEQLYVGSVIGTILILIGLYMVLWGKKEEIKKMIMSTTLPIKDLEQPTNTAENGHLGVEDVDGGAAADSVSGVNDANIKYLTVES